VILLDAAKLVAQIGKLFWQRANIGVKKVAKNFPECLLENENVGSGVM
jgi:hypothetical protein